MTQLDAAIDAYFAGERVVGLTLVPYGILALVVAIGIFRTGSGGFATGMAVPLLLLALVAAGAGGFLACKTPAQVDLLKRDLAADHGTALGDELTRMARVNTNWPRLKLTWAVLAAAGFALASWAGREWAPGLALGLLVISTTFMIVDTLAERRAAVYTRALESAQRALSPPRPSASP